MSQNTGLCEIGGVSKIRSCENACFYRYLQCFQGVGGSWGRGCVHIYIYVIRGSSTALRRGGFTHLSIPSSSGIRSTSFWESNAHCKHLDFLVFCYRQQADDDQGEMCRWATPEMQTEMNNLPALLKAMPFPEKKAILLDPELDFPFCEWLQLCVALHRC